MSVKLFSQKLKYARHKKGLLQSQLAEKVEVSRTTITNFETGYARPSPDLLKRICEILEIEKSWILRVDDGFYYDIDDKEIESKTPSEFGMKLRLLRKSNGWTLDDVAKRLYVSKSGYSKYELGTAEPNFTNLKRLTQIFNVSADDLLGISNDDSSSLMEDWIIDIANTLGPKKKAIEVIWKEIKTLNSRN